MYDIIIDDSAKVRTTHTCDVFPLLSEGNSVQNITYFVDDQKHMIIIPHTGYKRIHVIPSFTEAEVEEPSGP
jgi:hypothetical protein